MAESIKKEVLEIKAAGQKKLLMVLLFVLVMTCCLSLFGLYALLPYVTVKGSGNVVSEQRTVKDVTSVEMEIVAHLYVSQGTEEKLLLEGEDNILQEVSTRIEGNKLVISQKDKFLDFFYTLQPTKPLTLYLTLSNLVEIILSGAGNITIVGKHNGDAVSEEFKTDKLTINANGSGELNFQVDAKELNVQVNGVSKVTATGNAQEQNVTVNGSLEYDASQLASGKTDVVINGQGNANVNVDNELNVVINGQGNVQYSGNPEVTEIIKGIGRVQKASD